MPDELLRQAIRHLNVGGTDPAVWRNLSAGELMQLRLHLSARTPASVVRAIEARLAAAEATDAQQMMGQGLRTRGRRHMIVLVMMLGLLVAAAAFLAR
jgi:hypothetical protein